MLDTITSEAVETIAKAPQHVQGHAWELLAEGKANNAEHAIAYAIQAAKRRESVLTANMSELSAAGVVEGSNAINYSPMTQENGVEFLCGLLCDSGYQGAADDLVRVANGERLSTATRTHERRKAQLRQLIQRLIDEQS